MANKETEFVVRDGTGRVRITQAGTEIRAREHDDDGDPPVPFFSESKPSLTGRRILIINPANQGNGHIWIGGSDVNSTDKGFRIANWPGENNDDEIIVLDLAAAADIWWTEAGNVERPATLEIK